MLNHLTPDHIRAPFARYSHGVEVRAGARLLFCSGQLGIDKDDSVPIEAEDQAALCLSNIAAVLAEAGMDASHIVRLNTYVTSQEHLAGYMRARDDFCRDLEHAPASTLMIVSGFARPEFKVEVEAIAAAEEREQ